MNPDIIGHGASNPDFDPVDQLSYEQARGELQEIVSILERGQMSLDDSLKFWERGEALAKRCEQHLEGAQQRVEQALGVGAEDDE